MTLTIPELAAGLSAQPQSVASALRKARIPFNRRRGLVYEMPKPGSDELTVFLNKLIKLSIKETS